MYFIYWHIYNIGIFLYNIFLFQKTKYHWNKLCYQLEAEIIFDKKFKHVIPASSATHHAARKNFPVDMERLFISISLSPFFFSVPSASMTRLARSRTASLTSAGSVDGSRNRACTHSNSSEGIGQVSHTMEVSCWTLVHCLTCTHLERCGMEGRCEKNGGLILLSFFFSQPFF